MQTNKIYLGDFRDIFGYKFQDFNFSNATFISDPPYNINFKYNKYKDNFTDEEYIEMMSEFQECKSVFIHYPEEVMRYFVPSMGIPDEVIAWCYNSNINRRFRLINFYNCKPDFSKVKQPYKNPTDKRVKKLIEQGSKGTNIYDWWSDIQLVKNVSKEKTKHPCPIPEKLIERIILMTTEKGDLVVDPFCGGGTVCLVAQKLGRNYIGCEIDEKYFNIAEQRLIKQTLF